MHLMTTALPTGHYILVVDIVWSSLTCKYKKMPSCNVCSTPTSTLCACRMTYYCSRECQVADRCAHRGHCIPCDKIIDALHGKLMCSVASFAKKFMASEVNVNFNTSYGSYAQRPTFRFAEILCAKEAPHQDHITALYIFQDVTFVRKVDKKTSTVDIRCENPWTLLVEA